MKSTLLAIVFVLTATILHAQSALTPLEFNDKLTQVTDSLYARGQAWGLQFNQAYKSKDFKSLTSYRQGMVQFINANIARINAMKDVKNSKPLRMAMISFLRFELHMATDAFQPMEKFTPSSTNEEIKTAYDNLKALSGGEEPELAKVAAAQEAYAKENGFRIETEAEAKAKGN